MGSTRLPGKVLADIGGRPMLARVVERLAGCPEIDEVTVATTTEPDDDAILPVAERSGARWSRGDPLDVLARYAVAARESAADVVVRVTADCPLVDPSVVARVVRGLLDGEPCDYASNVIERSFPRGLDTEAFHSETLHRAARLARSANAREHVTWFIYAERPDLWVRRSIVDDKDNSDLRWTVDTPEDLELIRRLFGAIDGRETADDYRSLIRHVRAHPELAEANRHVQQRAP